MSFHEQRACSPVRVLSRKALRAIGKHVLGAKHRKRSQEYIPEVRESVLAVGSSCSPGREVGCGKCIDIRRPRWRLDAVAADAAAGYAVVLPGRWACGAAAANGPRPPDHLRVSGL